MSKTENFDIEALTSGTVKFTDDEMAKVVGGQGIDGIVEAVDKAGFLYDVGDRVRVIGPYLSGSVGEVRMCVWLTKLPELEKIPGYFVALENERGMRSFAQEQLERC